MLSVETNKTLLRQEFRKRRQQLSQTEQQQAAQDLVINCCNYTPFKVAKNIACYLSNDGELDTQYIIEYCWQKHISVLLPVVDPQKVGHLQFLVHQAKAPMQRNQYGIAEPVWSADKVLAIDEIDIIFTPLVAFDMQGNRLGMGGGYYDRTLATLSEHHNAPQLIGLAHDCQQAENLPLQSWDIPLQGVITPTQIFTF